MAKSFTYPLNYDIADILAQARDVSERKNIPFEGDEKSGSLSLPKMKFAAHYKIEGDHITVTVTKKPLVLPWKLVEQQFEEIFVKAPGRQPQAEE